MHRRSMRTVFLIPVSESPLERLVYRRWDQQIRWRRSDGICVSEFGLEHCGHDVDAARWNRFGGPQDDVLPWPRWVRLQRKLLQAMEFTIDKYALHLAGGRHFTTSVTQVETHAVAQSVTLDNLKERFSSG